ncbi:hypothetical protein [Burkholderia cenocepacia]|uniref:hypothetical protein n=1 Tax=Burkholderia cenocepacia TaxID=95486 RepID=UPI00285D22F0|nr:hypothetical protein [Burkholderia cenocepacia]MDR8054191.1 hypothetical protein [Burkholderia cenocepacia]MDR8064634.1 hypothetical protein [Burkholderia cenocepacia]
MKKFLFALSTITTLFSANAYAGPIVAASSPKATSAQATKKTPKKKYSTEEDFKQCNGVKGTEAINECLKKSKPLTI